MRTGQYTLQALDLPCMLEYSGTPLQWTPSGPTILSFIVRCPNSGASGTFLVGMVLCNWAVEHNVITFSELSLAVHWQGKLSRGKYSE